MGCGAVCGSSSSIAECSKQAEVHFMRLFKQITPNKYLYPIKAIAKFSKEMQLNPHRLQVILTQKLQAKSVVSAGIMQKWKILLFGLDSQQSQYVNCLGYQELYKKSPPSPDKPTQQQTNTTKQAQQIIVNENIEILEHKQFSQIEKDIQRTFPTYQFSKQSFKSILKRITNHFPIMGYTQGINFIIGYLLIIGYSENDTFWLFIHMALNKRYMMLGLYEDGFPLINVYKLIFKNMLKRLNVKLYQHLYENVVMFDQSAWVFKWFMTCYLSSFPLQMCQFVWDLMICLGSIGLVRFGVSLVLKLQKYLLQYDDASDLTEFLSQLKNIQVFNQFINIRDIVRNTYVINVQKQDLQGLDQVKTQRGGFNFYAQYFIIKFQQQFQNRKRSPTPQPKQLAQATKQLNATNPILFKKISKKQSTMLLNRWYDRLTNQRIEFKTKQRQKMNKKIIINNLKSLTVIQMQNSQKISDTIVQLNQHQNQHEIPTIIELTKQSKTSISLQHYNSSNAISLQQKIARIQSGTMIGVGSGYKQNVRMDSAQISPRNNKTKKQITITAANRYSIKKTKIQSPIWNDNQQEQQQKQQKKDKMEIQDQFYYVPRDIRFKRKNNKQQPTDILSQYSNTKKTKQIAQNPYSVRVMYTSTKPEEIRQPQTSTLNLNRSRLARVGHSVLSNMSASNASNKSSASSHRTVQKQNTLAITGRQCKCPKNKTQQAILQLEPNQIPIMRKRIQRANQPSQMDDHEHDHQQSVDDLNSRKKRLNTYHDWMVNSQGPRHDTNLALSNVKPVSEIGSQVQIVHGGAQMFKKKNRVNRVGGGFVIHQCQNIQQKQLSQCQSRIQPHPMFGEEESCQSVFMGKTSSRKQDLCEIQSVK